VATEPPLTLICRAMQALLLNKTPAVTNVNVDRSLSYRRDDLPAISVFADDEQVDEASTNTAPRENKILAFVKVVCILKETDHFVANRGNKLEEALNYFGWLARRAIYADYTLAGTAADCVLSSMQKLRPEKGEDQIWAIDVTFKVWYFEYAPDGADVDLPNFDYADIRYSLGNQVHVDNQAHDVLENLYTL
jgi:hypothetical protein